MRHPDRPGRYPDVLGTDPDEPHGHPRRRLLVTVLAGLALAAAVADQQVRAAEFDALLAQARAGQSAISYADGRIGATVQYASPVLGSSQTSSRVRASLEGIVSAEAARQAEALRDRAAASAAIRVLPWHSAHREARRAYTGYLAATAAYLQRVAADFDALYGRPPELAARLGAAARAYDAAAPGSRAATDARQLLLGSVRGSLPPPTSRG